MALKPHLADCLHLSIKLYWNSAVSLVGTGSTAVLTLQQQTRPPTLGCEGGTPWTLGTPGCLPPGRGLGPEINACPQMTTVTPNQLPVMDATPGSRDMTKSVTNMLTVPSHRKLRKRVNL